MVTKLNIKSFVTGGILILFGMLSLFGELLQTNTFAETFWPLIIVGFGILFFMGIWLGGKASAGLAIPGSIITVTGIVLFVQNLTHAWESWAYAWALIVAAVALGNFLSGKISGNESSSKAGLRLMKIALFLFFSFGALFEGLIFTATPIHQYGKWIFPLGLILLGSFIIVTRTSLFSGTNENRHN